VTGRAHHCQNGRADVCLASQRDGVICPEESCDIDDGVRADHTKAAPAAVAGGEAECSCDELTQEADGSISGLCSVCLEYLRPKPVQAAPQEGEDEDDTEPTPLQIEYARGYGDGVQDAEKWQAEREAANPSACELGTVREALEAAARSLRTIAEQAGKTEGLDDMMNVRGYANSRANVAELALQHRGDSRGGEG
jgi:hypothetical protein